MATITQVVRPYAVATNNLTSNTFADVQNILDADSNTYMQSTRKATTDQQLYLAYDLSFVPSTATVTAVSVDFVLLAAVNASSFKAKWTTFTGWSTTPTGTTVGAMSGLSVWASSSGIALTRSTTKTTQTKTGQNLQNNSRDFFNDVNNAHRSTFLSDKIAVHITFGKSSSTANAYFYDVPITITYTIPTSTITVNAGTGGTATGGGEYANGTQITISATPNTGYRFVSWNDGNTSASRTITVNGDATYTASFALIQYTISTAVSPTGSGTVTGGGTYNYGSSVTLTAVPATGYAFVKWEDNNSSTNPRSFTAYANGSYTAIFERSVIEPAITNISFNPSRVQASQYSIITVTMEQI